MDLIILNCTICHIHFWTPQRGNIKRIKVNGYYYCERCARRMKRRKAEMEKLNKNCAIKISSAMVGKIVVVSPPKI